MLSRGFAIGSGASNSSGVVPHIIDLPMILFSGSELFVGEAIGDSKRDNEQHR